MANYFVKYKNIAIYCDISQKLSGWGTPVYKVIHMQNEEDFESFRRQSPYANCVKMDLQEQLIGKNLKKTMPKRVRECILDIPEVRSLLRDAKINEILNDLV